MKLLKFKLLFVLVLLISVNAIAKETFDKRIHEEYSLTDNSRFEIENKFGEIKIENWNKNLISIDVVITVETKNQEKAEKIFKKIKVDIEQRGDLISAITDLDGSISNINFSIDYFITMPENLTIDLTNKFGSVIINSLVGDTKLNVQYGSLQASSLDFKNSIAGEVQISYGSGNIKFCTNLNMEVKYSALDVETADVLNLKTRFSSAEIGNVKLLKLDSKYDNVECSIINELNCIGKFSNIEVDRIISSLDLEFEYGNFDVADVDPGFSHIIINNKYGDIDISMDPTVSYKIDAIIDYCGIDIPSGNDLKIIKDESHKEVRGIIGDNKNTTSKVKIVSKYGDIDLD